MICFNLVITANGLGICEGRALEIRLPKSGTNADRSTNVQLLPSALLLQIPSCVPFLVLLINVVLVFENNSIFNNCLAAKKVFIIVKWAFVPNK